MPLHQRGFLTQSGGIRPNQGLAYQIIPSITSRFPLKTGQALYVAAIIRHYLHLLDEGAQLPFIQQLLGHSDVKTTMIYTHVTTQSVANVVSPLDRLNNLRSHWRAGKSETQPWKQERSWWFMNNIVEAILYPWHFLFPTQAPSSMRGRGHTSAMLDKT